LMIELRRRRYPDPWGRSSLGDAKSLKAATIDDVRNFYTTHYRPRGAILAIAGHFDWRRLREHVEQLFGDWEPQDVSEPASIETMPQNGHIQFDSSQSHIGVAYPTIPYKHPDY